MNKTCFVVSCNNNGSRDRFDGTASFTPRYHTCTLSDKKYCDCISKLFDIPIEMISEFKEKCE